MSPPELSREARALIEAAGGGDEPTAEELRRTRGKVLARVGLAAGAGAAVLAPASAAASAGAGLTVWKIGLAVVLLGAGGGAAAVALREPAAPVAAAPAALERAAAAPEPRAAEAPVPAKGEPEAAREPEKRPARKAVAPVKASVAVDGTLDRELAQVGKAQAALRDGKGAEALEALGGADGGALAEERQAARVFALCQVGKDAEAKQAAQAFLAKYPRSPQVARVRGSCGGK